MDEKEKFNGYANYGTWAVCLWLGSDEGSHGYWREAAREEISHAAVRSEEGEYASYVRYLAAQFLAERLKVELAEAMPELGPNLYSDLLNAAFSEIDWYEVADTFLDESFEPSTGLKFPLGRVVATPAVTDVIDSEDIAAALARHAAGDWGECGPEDAEENEISLRAGGRLFSLHRSRKGEQFWVITGADRSSTTVLMPGDY